MSATGPWSAERDGRWMRRDGEERVGWDEGGGWNRVSCACLVDLWGHVDRDKVEVVLHVSYLLRRRAHPPRQSLRAMIIIARPFPPLCHTTLYQPDTGLSTFSHCALLDL